MICYFRTTRKGAEIIKQIFQDIPFMVLRSIRSTYITHYYTAAERIIYDLDPEDWYTEMKITDTTHILVIPSIFYMDAEVRAVINNITIPWMHIQQRSLNKDKWHYRDYYAYEGNNGNIFFKLPGFRRQMKFDKSVLIEN